MPEPIYSRRYPKKGKNGCMEDEMKFENWGKEKRDFTRGQLRRNMIFGKVVELTNQNELDVDIFEGNGTLLVKIYLDFPCTICESESIFSMAGTISINGAKDGHDAVLSIFYDL